MGGGLIFLKLWAELPVTTPLNISISSALIQIWRSCSNKDFHLIVQSLDDSDPFALTVGEKRGST